MINIKDKIETTKNHNMFNFMGFIDVILHKIKSKAKVIVSLIDIFLLYFI